MAGIYTTLRKEDSRKHRSSFILVSIRLILLFLHKETFKNRLRRKNFLKICKITPLFLMQSGMTQNTKLLTFNHQPVTWWQRGRKSNCSFLRKGKGRRRGHSLSGKNVGWSDENFEGVTKFFPDILSPHQNFYPIFLSPTKTFTRNSIWQLKFNWTKIHFIWTV